MNNNKLFKILTTSILSVVALTSVARAAGAETDIQFAVGIFGNIYTAGFQDTKIDSGIATLTRSGMKIGADSSANVFGGTSGSLKVETEMYFAGGLQALVNLGYFNIGGFVGYQADVVNTLTSAADVKVTLKSVSQASRLVTDQAAADVEFMSKDALKYTFTNQAGLIFGPKVGFNYGFTEGFSGGIEVAANFTYLKDKIEHSKSTFVNTGAATDPISTTITTEWNSENESSVKFSGLKIVANGVIDVAEGVQIAVQGGILYQPAIEVKFEKIAVTTTTAETVKTKFTTANNVAITANDYNADSRRITATTTPAVTYTALDAGAATHGIKVSDDDLKKALGSVKSEIPSNFRGTVGISLLIVM